MSSLFVQVFHRFSLVLRVIATDQQRCSYFRFELSAAMFALSGFAQLATFAQLRRNSVALTCSCRGFHQRFCFRPDGLLNRPRPACPEPQRPGKPGSAAALPNCSLPTRVSAPPRASPPGRCRNAKTTSPKARGCPIQADARTTNQPNSPTLPGCTVRGRWNGTVSSGDAVELFHCWS